jgi:hypothetical protein
MILYQGLNNPLIGRWNNRIEFINEICISYSCFHIIFFTDWIKEKELQYQLGWSMLAVTVFCILFNFYFIFYHGLWSLFVMAKKLKRIVNNKLKRWILVYLKVVIERPIL